MIENNTVAEFNLIYMWKNVPPHINIIKIYNCANSIMFNQHITRNLQNTGKWMYTEIFMSAENLFGKYSEFGIWIAFPYSC